MLKLPIIALRPDAHIRESVLYEVTAFCRRSISVLLGVVGEECNLHAVSSFVRQIIYDGGN